VASKIDILFDIDNSASMSDKQRYLSEAISEFIDRLVHPYCVDTSGNVLGASIAGSCAQGALEFAPVTDMHLGVLTSSLGSRLGDVCDPGAQAPAPFANLSAHNDDQGHLVARSLTFSSNGSAATEAPVADAAAGFLGWYPGGASAGASSGAAAGSENALVADVQSMIGGAGMWGCGVESPLESWYRFLIQPDPYQSLASASTPVGMWQGVDATILRQRHDFLRPDSLVAVLVLSDENDSEIDVRSLGGSGYYFMNHSFQPPAGTQACSSDPGSAACQSCSLASSASDPACAPAAGSGHSYKTYTAQNDWGYDLNLRHVHMKAKYGLDPQYPIERYVTGLQQQQVPDRFGEYPADSGGHPASNYVGQNDCQNPLYAANLPDGTDLTPSTLCNLTPGGRSTGLVVFAHIGGVPSQLLHFVPNDPTASALSDADWVRILGRDPEHYDYTGIDPHMIEDYRDRTTVQYPFPTDSSMTNPLAASSTAPNAGDPTNGREWVTDQEMTAGTHVLPVDRQYACTFALPAARDCSLVSNYNACDCPPVNGGLTGAQNPPVCDPNTQNMQVAGKAYPTVRELLLAKLLGTQAVVSSICPVHVTEAAPGDPLYGYRPALSLLVDRMKSHLAQ
jgi:hypothetical protein